MRTLERILYPDPLFANPREKCHLKCLKRCVKQNDSLLLHYLVVLIPFDHCFNYFRKLFINSKNSDNAGFCFSSFKIMYNSIIYIYVA